MGPIHDTSRTVSDTNIITYAHQQTGGELYAVYVVVFIEIGLNRSARLVNE